MGQHEQNFNAASLELMEARNRKQELERENTDLNNVEEQLRGELNDVGGRLEREEQSKESKLNNCRAVKENFDESPENLMIMAEIESQKNAYLLNALSYLCNNQVLGNEVP